VVETSLLAAPPFAAAPTRPGNAFVTLLPPRSIARIAAFKDSLAPLQNALGLTLPAPAKQTYHNAVLYLWSGPGAWLAIAADDNPDFDTQLTQICNGLAAVTDQSDGRTILRICGPGTREALAKLIPIDLHPSAFPPDATALTLAGHISVQIWNTPNGFELSCFRSYTETLYEALIEASNV
jgi:heterotetrameric sarcosine oxidase gamma subunit